MTRFYILLISLIFLITPVQAEHLFEVYTGNQSVSSHDVSGEDVNGDPFNFRVNWEGRAHSSPIYFGARYSYQWTPSLAVALNYTHSKAYATDESKSANGFSKMKFANGLNPITLNGVYSVTSGQRWNVFFGGGVGAARTHIELQSSNMSQPEEGYQWVTPVIQIMSGVRYFLNERWFINTEYSFHFIWLDVAMGEGRFTTNFQTHAVNFGLGYRF